MIRFHIKIIRYILIIQFICLYGITVAQERYVFQQAKMGTTFTFILYTTDSLTAEATAQKAFKRIDELNNIFSDYLPSSEVSKLSKTAGTNRKVKVSKDMWHLLRKAHKISKKSNGAFDITIGPLSRLWRSMIRKQDFFDKVKINAVKKLVNYKNIQYYLFSRRIKLKVAGMQLDFGGIAKGYAVDEAVKICRDSGLDQILVDGGGDIFAGKAPPNKAGWKVLFWGIDKSGMKVEKEIILAYKAIASSGNTYKYLEWEGKRYAHIVDPRTGYGILHSKIVNILAPNCTKADAIASTLSVLENSKKFLKKVRRVELIY